jgi:hypothetical protein
MQSFSLNYPSSPEKLLLVTSFIRRLLGFDGLFNFRSFFGLGDLPGSPAGTFSGSRSGRLFR